MYIIIIGNPTDGFAFYGPFPNHEAAHRFASGNKLNNWWIATLQSI